MIATTHAGWYRTGATLALPPVPNAGWSIEAGPDVVLVAYSENRPTPGTFDKGVANDELVVQVPAAALQAGADVALDGLPARYQRGSARLTYVGLTITGTLHIDSLAGEKVAGTIELVSVSPVLDLLEAGEVRAKMTFVVGRKTA